MKMLLVTTTLALFVQFVHSVPAAEPGFLKCSTETPEFPNIHSIAIQGDAPELGQINIMHIQFNISRSLPFTSTTVFDSLNQQKKVNRHDAFRQHPCLKEYQTNCKSSFKMTQDQKDVSNGFSSYDRGHLVPSSPFLFSKSANKNTFFCLNMAPQDPLTNQRPWEKLEKKVEHYFAESAGYVITGLCDEESSYSPTQAGYSVPDCYYKLICYKDNGGLTQVVGFIGNNSILPKGAMDEINERHRSTLAPRSQVEVLTTVLRRENVPLIAAAWKGAELNLLTGRNDIEDIPTADECAAVNHKELSQDVIEDWD